jgi:hypothetical protein
LDFSLLFLQNEIKHHAKKISFFHFGFWPQEAKKKTKKLKSSHLPNEKFSILDKTKHTYKKFDILYFIILK